MLCQERNMRRHQDISLQENIEKNINADFHIFFINISFNSRSIQSDITIGQIIEELNKRRNNIVKFVLLHFFSDLSNQSLERRLNPFISYVKFVLQLFNIFDKNESFSGLRFKPFNILDQKSIGIVPRQKDILDNFIDILFCEFQSVGSHQGRVDQIKSASISTVVFANFKRFRIVFKSLRHFLAFMI